MIEQSIIHLLPDSICNQIAAGEIIQRPASVVKELLENSIDALSKKIVIAISDGGKDLIQVIDDGIGMSELDARMCLEKHATSKIKASEDLYNIKTLGFRGEAIPSIISVAHVEIMTRTRQSDIGTRLVIKGSKVQCQEPCVTPVGTNFSVRNLFFNIPVRRTFLKNNHIETQHILRELIKVALANCDVEFVFINNGKEELHLHPTTLINRICDLFGEQYRKELILCEDEDMFVKLEGYVALPQALRKYKKDSFLFVNRRYIKSQYINQAIISAYDNLVSNDKNPFYFLFLTIDTKDIDINIHPMKIEVKFQNEEVLYTFIRNSLRRLLYKNDLPEIDFDLRENASMANKIASFFMPINNDEEYICEDDKKNDTACNNSQHTCSELVDSTSINENKNYNCYAGISRDSSGESKNNSKCTTDNFECLGNNMEGYEYNNSTYNSSSTETCYNKKYEKVIYNGVTESNISDSKTDIKNCSNNLDIKHDDIYAQNWNVTLQQDIMFSSIEDKNKSKSSKSVFDSSQEGINSIIHVKPCYIVSTVKSGVIFVHQRRAHIRILYEDMINDFKKNGTSLQQLLFPKTVVLDGKDYEICMSNKAYLNELGFIFDVGVNNEIVITGLPSSALSPEYASDVFKDILEEIYVGGEVNLFHTLAKNIAIHKAIKSDEVPKTTEMWSLVNRLFLCENPRFDLKGNKIFYIMSNEEISSLL